MIDIDRKALVNGLLNSTYVRLSISTVGVFDSTYVCVSPAYLALVGRHWDELAAVNLIGKGAAISSSARDRRLFLITAQRISIGVQVFDVEMFQSLPDL